MAAWLRRLSLAVTTQLERGQQQHRQLGECTDNNALTLYALCTGSAIALLGLRLVHTGSCLHSAHNRASGQL